ncbi:hypothetical protein BJ170DRAFT_122056, partial [Xylariales sp. AK1849]
GIFGISVQPTEQAYHNFTNHSLTWPDTTRNKAEDLFDMAKDGTKVPGDAGKMNLIPSKPSPTQHDPTDGLGATSLHNAADKAWIQQ